MTVSGILGAFGLLGSSGLPSYAGDTLDKACEVLFDKKGKEILEEVQARLRAYRGSVPANHDLEHAIRLSELTATLVLLERYRQTVEAENFDNRAVLQVPLSPREWLSGSDPRDPFIGKARSWLFTEIGLCPTLKIKPNNVIVAEINASLDRVLPETRSASIEQGLAEAREQVWAAMIAGVGQAPPGFEASFYGRQEGEPGWSVLFLAFIREALKNNSRAEVAFVNTRLSGIRETVYRVDKNLVSVMDHVTLLREDVSELLLLIRQNQGAQSERRYKYFDTKSRDLIRSKFSVYRQEHHIDLPELGRRIDEHLGDGSEISVKTLRRFMKGIRVDDSFVEDLTRFADTIAAPPPVPVISSISTVELAVNDRAEVVVFFDKKALPHDLMWLEFNVDNSALRFVLDGSLRVFGVPVEEELAKYVRRASRVLMVLMDDNNEPVGGNYFPLHVVRFYREEDTTKIE